MPNIWDNPDLQNQSYDKPYFVSKLQDNQSLVMKFLRMEHKQQDPNAKFPSKDGMIWEFWLSNKDGKEQYLQQNSNKGKFYTAMKDANIQPDDIIKIIRQTEEGYPKWEIEKLTEWPEESLYEQTKEFRNEEIPTDQIPF